MATWEDGPEYAPLARPDAYTSATEPLKPIRLQPFTTPQAPPPPLGFQQAPGAKPLGDYLPPKEETRNASEPFELATAMLTTSGWEAGKLEEVDPKLPIGPAPRAYASTQVVTQTIPAKAGPPVFQGTSQTGVYPTPREPTFPTYPPGTFPQPGTPAWFAGAQARPKPPEPVTLGRVLEAVTYGVLITLFLGSIIQPFALLMFVLAFVLSSRIRYRTKAVLTIFWAGTILIAASGLALFDLWGGGILDQLDYLNGISIWVCRFALVALLITVWRALYNHERPSKR